jgi:hypothetical protein
MVQFILIAFLSLSAQADFFGFGGDGESGSKIPAIVEKLSGTTLNANGAFEDEFNKNVRSLEAAVEEEKLFCSGEITDSKGRVLPAEKKTLCFRDLKKNYLNATQAIFELKKKYLDILHQKQIDQLSENNKRIKADIEKSF